MTDEAETPTLIPGHFADSDHEVHSRLLDVIADVNGAVSIERANALAHMLTAKLREHRIGLLYLPTKEERHDQDAILWWQLIPYADDETTDDPGSSVD